VSVHPFTPGDPVLVVHAGRSFRHLRHAKFVRAFRGYVTATALDYEDSTFVVDVRLTEPPWEKWERIPVEFVGHMDVVERLARLANPCPVPSSRRTPTSSSPTR